MRKTLLASTAIAFGLALGGPAFAADMKSDADVKADSKIQTEINKNGSEAKTGVGVDTKMGADADMHSDAKMDDGKSYRSYSDAKDFAGTIAGGFTAEELIGTDVVDANGDEVGEISDILISANNKAETVLVDVGGFLGIGEKRVALPLDALKKQDDVLVTSKTEAELEGMASYSEDGDSWLLDDDRATTAPKSE